MRAVENAELEGLASSDLVLGVIVRKPNPPKFQVDQIYERLHGLGEKYPTLQRLFPRNNTQWLYTFFDLLSSTIFDADMANLGILRITDRGREYIQQVIFPNTSPKIHQALDSIAEKVWLDSRTSIQYTFSKSQ